MTSPASTSCPSPPYPLCVWGLGARGGRGRAGATALSALGDGGVKGTVETGAPSQAASVGHLAGTWSARRVVWVWVVRERWSACSAGANLHIVINMI
jgi:hypothetical protein